MRKLLAVALMLLASSQSYADPITGVTGFEYKTYKKSSPPKDLAKLKLGSSSAVGCDELGFVTKYGAVWDNVKNIVDTVMSSKKTLLLGAVQYLLAKSAPTLYSVLSKLNHLSELALKYNFDACALYKKAQAEAEKNTTQMGLEGICLSLTGDKELCSAPGKALEVVFGKRSVDVVDEVIKDREVADLVKALVGTVVMQATGSGMTTTYYSPTWKLGDVFSGIYKAYFDKYAEIAEAVHNGKLTEDEYYSKYSPWITIGGEINLSKVKVENGFIDLSEARTSGYQIPYEFFYEVAQFPPETATRYVAKLAQLAATIDLQSLLLAIQKALVSGATSSGKGGVLPNKVMLERIKKDYQGFVEVFGNSGKEEIVALVKSARARYQSILAAQLNSAARPENRLAEALVSGPPVNFGNKE